LRLLPPAGIRHRMGSAFSRRYGTCGAVSGCR
jgi:hypothetical protein